MHPASLYLFVSVLFWTLLTGCSLFPASLTEPEQSEVLMIYPDGSMRLMGRLVPVEDVVIYPDGFGGERAAIKVRIEPLHPNFYRDTIVVKRVQEHAIVEED